MKTLQGFESAFVYDWHTETFEAVYADLPRVIDRRFYKHPQTPTPPLGYPEPPRPITRIDTPSKPCQKKPPWKLVPISRAHPAQCSKK